MEGISWFSNLVDVHGFSRYPRHVSSNRQQSLQSHRRCQAARCQKAVNDWVLVEPKTPISDPCGMLFTIIYGMFFTMIYGICLIHVWYIYHTLPIFGCFLMVHVRKYTGPMDPMRTDVEADFQTKDMLKRRLFFFGENIRNPMTPWCFNCRIRCF